MRMLRLEGFKGLILPALSTRGFIGCADFAEVPMFRFKGVSLFILMSEVKTNFVEARRQGQAPFADEASAGNAGLTEVLVVEGLSVAEIAGFVGVDTDSA
ncbi:hypothetical protein TU75_23420 [Pseudomonas poae]|nr:hypothetical protein TU75_23420 [Pseudomonas poae]